MIRHGDCVEVMAAMDADSVDAIVTDPPYGIRFMGKAWDGADIESAARKDAETRKSVGPHSATRPGRAKARSSSAFGSRASAAGSYDFSLSGNRAFQSWCESWAAEALRVAKPGAYLLAFGGTRTFHRLACAVEDAGWEIRDTLMWGYATGFPKSRALLKPAWEPIVMARKPGPLRMLNIDDCRIPGAIPVVPQPSLNSPTGNVYGFQTGEGRNGEMSRADGRWPANIVLTDPVLDGGWEGVVGGGRASTGGDVKTARQGFANDSYMGNGGGTGEFESYGDSGTYSRFFLVPKASRADREPDGAPRKGPRVNTHPTVKPTALMQHLVRLVTPQGGTVLDPFLGSGTTAKACEIEGVEWVGIEREAESVAIAEARVDAVRRSRPDWVQPSLWGGEA